MEAAARTLRWRNHSLRVSEGELGCFDVELIGEPELGVFDHGAYSWTVSPPWLARVASGPDAAIDLQESLLLTMFAGS